MNEDDQSDDEALWSLVRKGLLDASYDADIDDWVFWPKVSIMESSDGE